MVLLIVCVLCMIPIPVIFVKSRKKPVSGGQLALIAMLNLFCGYLAGCLVVGVLYVFLGEIVFSGGAVGPGALLTVFVTYYLMKRNLRSRGLLDGYPPTGLISYVHSPENTPVSSTEYESNLPPTENSIDESDYPLSCVDLLSDLQSELEQKQDLNDSIAPQPTPKLNRFSSVIIGVLACFTIALAITVCILGTKLFSLTKSVSVPTETHQILRNYIAGKRGTKYHYLSCRYAEGITPENAVYFQYYTDAKAAGYEPCSVCHPMS